MARRIWCILLFKKSCSTSYSIYSKPGTAPQKGNIFAGVHQFFKNV
jgi:hypothetical protein